MISECAYEDGRLDALEKYFSKTAGPMTMGTPRPTAAIPRPGWQPPTARPPMAGAPQVTRASVGAANAQARAAGNPIAAAPMQPIPVDRAAAGAKNMRQRGAPMPGATTTTPAPATTTQPAATTQTAATTQPAAGTETSTAPTGIMANIKSQIVPTGVNLALMAGGGYLLDRLTQPKQQYDY